MFKTLKKIIGKGALFSLQSFRGQEETCDLWSENYDVRSGNIILDLDEEIFAKLLRNTVIKNKRIADIGCGSGRHWVKLFQHHPLNLTGFDVSSGILNCLQEKFPEAYTSKITDNLFSTTADATYDVIISTLTVAHIQHIEAALQSWSRILKNNGDIIITDFHPDALAIHGKRTFECHARQIEVQNYVHYLHDIEAIMRKHNFRVVQREEKTVDEWVRHYYVSKNALPMYEKFKDRSIIYGMHFRRVMS